MCLHGDLQVSLWHCAVRETFVQVSLITTLIRHQALNPMQKFTSFNFIFHTSEDLRNQILIYHLLTRLLRYFNSFNCIYLELSISHFYLFFSHSFFFLLHLLHVCGIEIKSMRRRSSCVCRYSH